MKAKELKKLFDSVECIDYAIVKNPKGKYVDLNRVPLDLWDEILRMIKKRELECLFYLDPDKLKELQS